MASFKTNQEYEEAKIEWLQVPHSAYIQKTGRCVQMTGSERMIVADPVAAQIIGITSYNAVGKIDNLNQRFRNSQIAHFKEFRHFKCILDIEEKAFSNCTQLCIIELPYSVLSIGDYAFYNCKSLEEIDMKPLHPPYIENDTIFKGCDCLRSINIWPSVINDYRKHPVWSKYQSLFKEKEMR